MRTVKNMKQNKLDVFMQDLSSRIVGCYNTMPQ